MANIQRYDFLSFMEFSKLLNDGRLLATATATEVGVFDVAVREEPAGQSR